MAARSWLRPVVVTALVAVCVGCDQVSKRTAEAHFSDSTGVHRSEVHSYWGDTLRILYAENTGSFLGWGSSWPEGLRYAVFSIATACVLAVIAWRVYAPGPIERTKLAALTLVLAGGLGNLADRFRDGYVVDFLQVGWGSVRTGIFNVADVAIMAGVVLLLLATFRPNAPAAPSRSSEQEEAAET